ncbi:MAG: hypothetical protein HYT70_01300 [Candidatus Aenigmarchaeota archaeon]|nr:hypothetical protein [Candidatus Aenigmarchaeota archaeon]
MSTKSEQPSKLLEQMKQELYRVIGNYADRLNVNRLRSYIDAFSIPQTTSSQILLSKLQELKRGPYLTPEVFRQFRQEFPPETSPDFHGRYGILTSFEHSIERYGEDALAHLILSSRSYHALLRSGIETISELRTFIETPPPYYTEDYRKAGMHPLKIIRNIGEKGASEIQRALEGFDNLRARK